MTTETKQFHVLVKSVRIPQQGETMRDIMVELELDEEQVIAFAHIFNTEANAIWDNRAKAQGVQPDEQGPGSL